MALTSTKHAFRFQHERVCSLLELMKPHYGGGIARTGGVKGMLGYSSKYPRFWYKK